MPEFDEELLSAYLDGELTAAERARVEKLLAEQPESRHLFEELRSIKTSLERMPRSRLPHDFADQVLRQAEKEVLTTPGDDRAGGAASGDGARAHESVEKVDRSERVERLSGFSWQRMRRPVIWASLTLAAGLLIMFLDRDRVRPAGRQQVAMAPGEAPMRGGTEIGAPAADEAERRRPLAREEPHSEVDFGRQEGPSGALQADDKEMGAAPSPDNRPFGAPEATKRELDERVTGRAARPSREAMDERGREALGAKDALKSELAYEAQERLSLLAADQTVVVWCDVSPDTKYNERFRQLLTRNSIAWNEEENLGEKAAAADRSLPETADKEGERKKAPGAQKPASAGTVASGVEGPASSHDADAKSIGALLQRRSNRQNYYRLEQAEQAALDPNAELVIVEASEPQIEAVLAELDRDDDVFKTVDVEPAADAPRQQQLQRYRRGVADVDELSKQSGSQKGNKLAKQVEETPPAPAQAAAGANQTSQSSPSGIAYKLRSRSAQLADKPQDKKPQEKMLDETRRLSAPADQNHLQVLFVLRPLDDAKPAAAAPLPAEKSPQDD